MKSRNRILSIAIVFAVVGWLASGLFIVRGDQRAAVLRCGKVVRGDSGGVALRTAGLHYDLPWPLSQIDRVNLNEVRTLTVGLVRESDEDLSGLLRDPNELWSTGQYLTGDRNILEVRLQVQYRLDAAHIDDYLYANDQPAERIRRLAEGVLSQTAAAAGVDYVHTAGRAELQRWLTASLQQEAADHRLGVVIEAVALETVQPPIRVKAAFLDVSNARADMQRSINAATGYAEQRQAEARFTAQQELDTSRAKATTRVQAATARAASFQRLHAELKNAAKQPGSEYAAVRRAALQSRYTQAMVRILARVRRRIVVGGERPGDLLLPIESQTPKPAVDIPERRSGP